MSSSRLPSRARSATPTSGTSRQLKLIQFFNKPISSSSPAVDAGNDNDDDVQTVDDPPNVCLLKTRKPTIFCLPISVSRVQVSLIPSSKGRIISAACNLLSMAPLAFVLECLLSVLHSDFRPLQGAAPAHDAAPPPAQPAPPARPQSPPLPVDVDDDMRRIFWRRRYPW